MGDADAFLRTYVVVFGSITASVALVVFLDRIGQRQERKRREKELDADGRSVGAYRTASH